MSISTRTVQVLPGTAVSVLALGLVDGEQLQVSYAIDLGCKPADAQYEPATECCADAIIGQDNNPLTLWRPGWYKIEPLGAINAGASLSISDAFPAQTTMMGNMCCPPSHVVNIGIEPDGRITLYYSDGTTVTSSSTVIIPNLIAAVFNNCDGNDHTPDVQLALCSDIPTPEDIAGVFRDCNGAQLIPNAQLPTCADIPTEDEMAGVFNNCDGDPMEPGEQIARCSDLPTDTQIAAVFNGCDDLPLTPGTKLATCDDLGDAIGEIGGAAQAPTTSEASALPTTMYGGRGAILGQPDGWMLVAGKKLPYWN